MSTYTGGRDSTVTSTILKINEWEEECLEEEDREEENKEGRERKRGRDRERVTCRWGEEKGEKVIQSQVQNEELSWCMIFKSVWRIPDIIGDCQWTK